MACMASTGTTVTGVGMALPLTMREPVTTTVSVEGVEFALGRPPCS